MPRPAAPILLALTCATLLRAQEPPQNLPEHVTAEPLAPRAAVDSPRFVRHDPADSGLVFQNLLRPENVLPYVYNGAGVTVGDYDGDGRCDVYLISQDGPNRLFRQVAPFRFEDVTEELGVEGGTAWGSGASFVDYDGDGDLDLYVANTEQSNLLYRNDGDRFTECAAEVGLDLVGACTMPAFADFDNDGDLDLYQVRNRVLGPDVFRPLLNRMTLPPDIQKTTKELAPQIPGLRRNPDGTWIIPDDLDGHLIPLMGRVFFGGQSDLLLRNDGGRFTDVTALAGIDDRSMGLSATWWDYDDDGWLDLFVANDLESPDALYHNERDGTFRLVTAETLPHLAYFGMGSDFADVDMDGRFDLVVADMAMRTHYKSKMLMGDMGDRGWFLQFGRPPQIMRNALFLNTGTGRFLECAQLSHVAKTDWTWAMKFGDLDCDGWPDLFVTNGVPRFDNDPDLNPRFRQLFNEGRLKEAIELAANVPPVPERNVALRNLGTTPGTPPDFVNMASVWGLDDEGVSQGASYADFDGDGDLDLIVNDMNAPAALYENRVDQGNQVAVLRLRGRGANTHGLGARISARAGALRLERLLTLPGGYLSTDEPQVFLGLGGHPRIDHLEIRWPGGGTTTLEDLPAGFRYVVSEASATIPESDIDARIPRSHAFEEVRDAVGLAPGSDNAEAWFDDFAAQPLVPHQHSQLGPGLALGDVDGDGHPEVWVGGSRGSSGILQRAEADGYMAIAGPWSDDAGSEDLGASFLDADGDGDLDLFVVSGSVEAPAGDAAYADRLYLNDGTGSFTHAGDDVLPGFRDSGGVVAACDFDHDGDVDLFAGGRVVPGRYPESPFSRLYRNEGGRFVDVTAEVAPQVRRAGLVTDAAWLDLDGDGSIELVVTAHWQPVRVFAQDSQGRFTDRSEDLGFAAHTGWWNSVVALDVDGDGDADLVTGNVGLNTKYKASPDKPAKLFVEDFDQSGSLDVIEAKYEGSRLLPVRGRSCSSRAIPMLGEKFPTYDEFARATLDDIYSGGALADAQRFEATELASLLWRQGDDGRFTAEPLPKLAQIAPVFGLAVSDLDGDGRDDVFLAQNFYTPEPETGRMAGGLGVWLRATAEGTLEPVPSADSGIVIPEDAKAALVSDFDGDHGPDLLLTTNGGPLRALRNRIGRQPRIVVLPEDLQSDDPPLRRERENPAWQRPVRWLAVDVGAAAVSGGELSLALDRTDWPRQTRWLGARSGYLAAPANVVFFGVPADGTARGELVLTVPGAAPRTLTVELTADEPSRRVELPR